MKDFNFSARGGFGSMLASTQGRQINEAVKGIDVHTTRGNATESSAAGIIERAIKKSGNFRKGSTYREKDLEVIFQDVSKGKTGSKLWEIVVNQDNLVGPWALATVTV